MRRGFGEHRPVTENQESGQGDHQCAQEEEPEIAPGRHRGGIETEQVFIPHLPRRKGRVGALHQQEPVRNPGSARHNG